MIQTLSHIKTLEIQEMHVNTFGIVCWLRVYCLVTLVTDVAVSIASLSSQRDTQYDCLTSILRRHQMEHAV